MLSPTPRLSGFTLIELLTVIAIIGVLAAILIPVTGSVREGARSAQCRSNIRQLATAAVLAAGERQGRFPAMKAFDWEQPDPNGPVRIAYMWQVLPTYLGIKNWPSDRYFPPFRCATVEARGRTGGNADFLTGDNFEFSHYRYNWQNANNAVMPREPSRAMLFFDTVWPDWNPRSWPHAPGEGASIHVAFADGHVAALTRARYVLEVGGSEEETDEFFRKGWRP